MGRGGDTAGVDAVAYGRPGLLGGDLIPEAMGLRDDRAGDKLPVLFPIVFSLSFGNGILRTMS